MKKLLFAASTLSHIENFHIPYLKYFKEQGYIIHIMGKPNNKLDISYCDKIIPIDFEKSILSLKNFRNAFKIAKIIKSEKYDIINVHTTLAAFFIRLGVILSFRKPKLLINTVHGYLFDDKTSFFKKAIMLLAEKVTKYVTDTIIVMNSQDYDIAFKHKLYKNNIYLINGMGVKLSKFPPISSEKKYELRKIHDFSKNDFILIYVAEFSKRKNQKFLLDSLKILLDRGYSNIKLLLLGNGQYLDELKLYAEKLKINDNVVFTGYVNNTSEYYQISDICISSSRIEGLPFNIIEAMSVGLPIIASKIKGHEDLVNINKNGFLFEYNNYDEFCKYIITLHNDKKLLEQMSANSHENSIRYSLDCVFHENINIISNEIELLR